MAQATVTEAHRLRQLEEEDRRLEHLVAVGLKLIIDTPP